MTGCFPRTNCPRTWPRSRSCRFDFQTAKQCQAYNRDLAAQDARVLPKLPPRKRAWGMPGARRTRSLVCAWGSEYAHEYSQRGRQNHPASPRSGFNSLFRALPGDRLSCHRRLWKSPSTNLTPASRRQDHTTSPSASMPFVIGTSSVHRIPPRVRDDREPPLRWDETAAISEVIWVRREEEIFLRRRLDR
jgi:hypothetical protein